jgi:hypothetical protein
MPLWRFIPVADKTDSRWQDRCIWHDVVVRAPNAAIARVLADQAEERLARGAVGNETSTSRGGFADANLYWVQRVHGDEAEAYGGESGPPGIVNKGTPEEPLLSVYYGTSMPRRNAGRKPGAA